ncbi:MAG: hypothetical protein WCY91_05155 [Acidithiobacillus sp.]
MAGISEQGSMRRLYPVPFRTIEEGQQFKKWQWIEVRIENTNKDQRPESHKVYVDTIRCGDVIDTKREWAARREWLDKIPSFQSFEALDEARLSNGLSIALLCPKTVLGLDIVKARHAEWTEEEKEKLTRAQMQGDLFSEADALYWNCRRDHGDEWEVPFRAKLEEQLGRKDLMFLMGNQHRFQDQWLIISLVYPPKRKPAEEQQGSLF